MVLKMWREIGDRVDPFQIALGNLDTGKVMSAVLAKANKDVTHLIANPLRRGTSCDAASAMSLMEMLNNPSELTSAVPASDEKKSKLNNKKKVKARYLEARREKARRATMENEASLEVKSMSRPGATVDHAHGGNDNGGSTSRRKGVAGGGEGSGGESRASLSGEVFEKEQSRSRPWRNCVATDNVLAPVAKRQPRDSSSWDSAVKQVTDAVGVVSAMSSAKSNRNSISGDATSDNAVDTPRCTRSKAAAGLRSGRAHDEAAVPVECGMMTPAPSVPGQNQINGEWTTGGTSSQIGLMSFGVEKAGLVMEESFVPCHQRAAAYSGGERSSARGCAARIMVDSADVEGGFEVPAGSSRVRGGSPRPGVISRRSRTQDCAPHHGCELDDDREAQNAGGPGFTVGDILRGSRGRAENNGGRASAINEGVGSWGDDRVAALGLGTPSTPAAVTDMRSVEPRALSTGGIPVTNSKGFANRPATSIAGATVIDMNGGGDRHAFTATPTRRHARFASEVVADDKGVATTYGRRPDARLRASTGSTSIFSDLEPRLGGTYHRRRASPTRRHNVSFSGEKPSTVSTRGSNMKSTGEAADTCWLPEIGIHGTSVRSGPPSPSTRHHGGALSNGATRPSPARGLAMSTSRDDRINQLLRSRVQPCDENLLVEAQGAVTRRVGTPAVNSRPTLDVLSVALTTQQQRSSGASSPKGASGAASRWRKSDCGGGLRPTAMLSDPTERKVDGLFMAARGAARNGGETALSPGSRRARTSDGEGHTTTAGGCHNLGSGTLLSPPRRAGVVSMPTAGAISSPLAMFKTNDGHIDDPLSTSRRKHRKTPSRSLH
uniref:Uncharacterized protein n=1 Tax=Tetraselmis chuii TaxID=63592 RepID=A0A7S1X4W4_9CHLO